MSKKSLLYVLGVCGLALTVVLMIAGNANRVSIQPDSFAGQDEEHHLLRGLLVYDALRLPDRKLFSDPSVTWQPRWPPLVYISTAPLIAIFGRSQGVMTMTIAIYFAILLISLFGIGVKYHSPIAGLIAVLVTATFPMLFRYSGYYNLDVPLAACVCLTMLLLFLSEGFTKRWVSIGFGIAFGLGLLAKITFPIFILPVIAADAWSRKKQKKPTQWFSLLVSFVVAGIISGFWYLPRLGMIIDDLLAHVFDYNRHYGLMQSESGEFFIFQAGRELGTACVLFILITILLGPAQKRITLLPLYAWFFIPTAIFLLAPSDISRFALPSLPAIALLVAIYVMTLPGKQKYVFGVLIGALICVNLVHCVRIATQPEPWLFMESQATDKKPWEVSDQVVRLFENDFTNPICYLQDIDSNKLSGEYFWFRIALERPQVRVALYDLFNNRYENYEQFNDCINREGIVLYWTDRKGIEWPDSESIERLSRLGGIVSHRGEETFLDLDFPPGFVPKDFPRSAAQIPDPALKTSVDFGAAGGLFNRFFVYVPQGVLKNRNQLHFAY